MDLTQLIQNKGQGIHSWVNKFGRAVIGTASLTTDIWDNAENTGGALYVYPSSATTLYASTDSGTANQTVAVEGLDANWNLQTKTVQLNGQNQVAIGGTWIRVFRAYNTSSTALPGHVYIAESATLTNGKPNTISKIKAMIHDNSGQTLMAIYAVPDGYTAYLTSYYVSIQRIGVAPTTRLEAGIRLRVREYEQAFRTLHWMNTSSDVGYFNHIFSVPMKINPKSDIKLQAYDSTDNTDICGGFDLILCR